MNKNLKTQVMDIVFKSEYSTVADLALQLEVSQSTIRRALCELQKNKLVIRTHGGVKPIKQDGEVPSFVLRRHLHSTQKKIIALKAIKLIKNGDVIFMDGSTSAFYVAQYLNEFQNLTVITNGIDTLTTLANYGINAISTGGNVLKTNHAVLTGQFALDCIDKLHADVAFISCGAISSNGRLTDYSIDEISICRKMSQNAKTTVLLCDHYKFDKTETYGFGELDSVDYMITDQALPDHFKINAHTKILY